MCEENYLKKIPIILMPTYSPIFNQAIQVVINSYSSSFDIIWSSNEFLNKILNENIELNVNKYIQSNQLNGGKYYIGSYIKK